MSLSFTAAAGGGSVLGLSVFAWLGIATALALLAYLLAAALSAERASAVRASLFIGWLAHAAAIVIDITGLGATASGPRFGFAPALSVTLWLVLAVYLIESRFLPLDRSRRALALLGGAAVALAWLFPGEVHAATVSRWAPLHWVLGIASYGLFGTAVLHASLLNRADRQMRSKQQVGGGAPLGLPLLRLERLTFRFVEAGFVTLTAAVALGWWFASPWRWDHKAIFSVLGWAVFAGLLVGRRSFGWRGPSATRWLYIGAVLLLLAYVGSRFVIEVLLQRPALPA
ncbi:cytochrome C assembly family protein [Piscinibacter sakaiensis]|uniref:cytochrome C assembly family protein n=1 Tax=Piscinibacter sakaiensis TaxID=1547922 RepID=UPI003AAB901B